MTPDEAKALADRFRRLYAGVVSDAMEFDLGFKNYVLDLNIKPLAPGGVLVGPAFTCHGEAIDEWKPEDDTLRLRMLEDMPPYSVMVIKGSDRLEVAHFGDITAMLLCGHESAGAVIDGYTRDSRRILESGWGQRVYCRGTNPIDAYGRWEITEYAIPIMMPGLTAWLIVSSDDWIFADADGVLVIPGDKAEEVCRRAEARAINEATIRAALARGEPPLKVYERLGRW